MNSKPPLPKLVATSATYAQTDGFFVYTSSKWRDADANSDAARRIEAEFPTTFYDIAWYYANVIDYARAKLAKKGCDLIVANDVGGTGVMGGDANTVHLVTTTGVETWPTLPKGEVANRLIAHIAGLAPARQAE